MLKKTVSIFLAVSLILQSAGAFAQNNVSEAADSETELKAWYTSPATDWESEATPLGNGFIGAMVFGGVDSDKIQINEHTLWSGGPGANEDYDGGHDGDSATVKESLQKVRQLLQNEATDFTNNKSAYRDGNGNIVSNDYSNSSEIDGLMNQLKGEKYNFGSFQTLGNIFIANPDYTDPLVEYATSSTEDDISTEVAANLFDGSTSTKWYAGNCRANYNITWPPTITWNYTKAYTFNNYSISSANDAEGRDPSEWRLYGSNDGNNYNLIDTRSGITFSNRNETRNFTLNNTYSYRYFKFEIVSSRESLPPQISEITLNNSNKGQTQYSDYVRSLDINKAVETVSYVENGVRYTKEYFISNPDNVMVIRITASKKGSIDRQIYIDSVQTHKKITVDGNTITMEGQPADQKENGLKFAQQIKVIPENGSIQKADNGVRVSGADSVLIVMSCGTNYVQCKDSSYNYFSGKNPLDAVSERVNKAVAKGYDALLSAHLADYKELFNRVDISFGSVNMPSKSTDRLLADYNNSNTAEENRYLEMLYYQFGRYLLIASSREGSLPANLQGIWAEGLNPPWDADYHTNINLEMNYWPAEQCNLAECHTSVIDYTNSLVTRGTETAQYYFVSQDGSPVRGWTTFHENNIWGNTGPANSYAFYFPAGAAWLCQDIWEYYQFNMDKEFLSENFNTMLQAALFWVDNLWEDSRDGTLVSNPSYSPEHGGFSLGTSCDQEIIWELFNMVIEASDVLGINTSEIQEIKNAQSKLYLPKVGLAGEYLEWKDETTMDITGDNGHRHVNHLFALHPGTLVVAGRSSEDDRLVSAMKKVLEVRGDGGTGWSKAWKINMWARLRDGDHAGVMVNQIISQSTLKNLFDTHAPFQIDGNFGATAGMTEMLLQSQGDSVDLLPALPTIWKDGYVSGIKARGNFEVSMKWSDKKLESATVKSGSGEDCTLSYDGLGTSKIVTSKGTDVSYTVDDNNTITFKTVKGETYYINSYPSHIDPEDLYKVTYVNNGNVEAEVSVAKGSSPAEFYQCADINNKLFAGWFTKEVQLTSVLDVKNSLAYAADLASIKDDTVLYAGWIDVGGTGNQLEIMGAQIRISDPSGLRFITRIGHDLVNKVEALNSANVPLKPDNAADKGIGYGTVATKASNVNSVSLVKDVNAVNAAKGMAVCPAEKLYDIQDDSNLYTCVVTGIAKSKFNTDISARPYVTYKDANGTEKTYYYTESDAASNAGGGYKTNVYAVADVLYKSDSVSTEMKTWLKNNILN